MECCGTVGKKNQCPECGFTALGSSGWATGTYSTHRDPASESMGWKTYCSLNEWAGTF